MSDSLLILLGAVLAWLGFILFLLALSTDWVRQRFTHRRRCPKCWYDLSQAPFIEQPDPQSSVPPQRSRTCPECGHTAKRERTLFKSRKHPFLAAGGLLLLIAGYFIHVTPEMKARGFVATMPTTALLAALPNVDRSQSAIGRYYWYNETFGDDVWAELFERASQGHLAHWQYKWLVQTCTDILNSSASAGTIDQDDAKRLLDTIYARGSIDDPAILAIAINPTFTLNSRAGWPSGSTVHIRDIDIKTFIYSDIRFRFMPKISGAESFIQPWNLADADPPSFLPEYRIGILPPNTDHVDFDVVVEWNRACRSYSPPHDNDWVELKRVAWSAPITVSGDISQYLTAVTLPRFETALRDSLQPLCRRSAPAALFLPLYKPEIKMSVSATPPTIFAAHLTILSGNQPLAQSSGLWILRGAVGIESARFEPMQTRVEVTSIPSDATNAESTQISFGQIDPANLQLRIQSDPDLALRCPDLSVHQYWQGDITVPLRVVDSH
ncbi:MAG TPA: hypothetical protein VG711_11560 [Phycisphaerales bacterium]|nr:hypothetical protein [Phycisphaerales bacterium]